MNRRVLGVVAALTAGGVSSGCATFTEDDIVARVGEHVLRVDELATILPAPAGAQRVTTADANQLVYLWIENHVLRDRFERDGHTVAPINEAATVILSAESLSAESTALHDGLVEFVAAEPPDPAELAAAYAADVDPPSVWCPAVIAVSEPADRQVVSDLLAAGTPFFEVAASHNLSPQYTAQAGRIQCTPPSVFGAANPTELVEALDPIGLGEVTGPVDLTVVNSTTQETATFAVWITKRPADDVTPDELVAPAVDPKVISFTWVAEADVYVNPRYGQFSAVNRAIQPLG